MFKNRSRIGVLFLSVLLLAGCGKQEAPGGPSGQAVQELDDDAKKIQVTLPDFLAGRPAEVQNIYRLAYGNQDILRYIPCYCGCVNEGYQSDLDCFLRGTNSDGSVRWDPMGHT